MAREYGKNWFSMWTDEDFCTGRLFDKLFYQVLIGQSGTNDAGICPINFRKWRKALRDGDAMPSERDLKASLVRQERRRYVFTDEDTGEVLIRSHIRRDEIFRQPALMIAALRDVASCQSPKFAAVLMEELERIDLPTVKAETPQGQRMRDSLKQADETARVRLETLLDGCEEPFQEPFEEDFPEGIPEPFVRPAETEPTQEPTHEGSPRPPVVVEVVVDPTSVGTHLGGEPPKTLGPLSIATPNPKRCSRHQDGPDPGPCGACADARRTTEASESDHRRAALLAAQVEREELAAIKAAEIANCELCDDDGYLPSNRVCDHIDHTTANAAGLEKIRAALAKENRSA